MRIGLIGLGKMGSNMVKRLRERGHEVVAFDLDEEAVSRAKEDGAEGAGSVADLMEQLPPPRVIWVMVPHGKPTREAITQVLYHTERSRFWRSGWPGCWPGSWKSGVGVSSSPAWTVPGTVAAIDKCGPTRLVHEHEVHRHEQRLHEQLFGPRRFSRQRGSRTAPCRSLRTC